MANSASTATQCSGGMQIAGRRLAVDAGVALGGGRCEVRVRRRDNKQEEVSNEHVLESQTKAVWDYRSTARSNTTNYRGRARQMWGKLLPRGKVVRPWEINSVPPGKRVQLPAADSTGVEFTDCDETLPLAVQELTLTE
jgi:hypothetical protein